MPKRAEGESLIGQAMAGLRSVKEMIDRGKSGATVLMPIDKAWYAFRISGETFGKLATQKQELGIAVVGKNVVVSLEEGEASRRADYLWLYGFCQAEATGQEKKYLSQFEPPAELLRRFPELESTVAIVKNPSAGLPNEETLHNFYLGVLFLSIKDKSGLFDPSLVFSAATR